VNTAAAPPASTLAATPWASWEWFPVPVWVVRAPDGLLVASNRRAAEWLRSDSSPAGQERDRFLGGLAVLDTAGRPVHRTALPLYRAIHEGVELRDWEATVLRPDGSLAGVLWNTSVMRGPDGRVAAAAAALTDIDVRRRGEARLRSDLDRRRQADRRKSRFFSALCHDLRSRLNGVGLTVQSLAGRPSVDGDPDAARETASLSRGVRELADALDELTAPSRAGSGPRLSDARVGSFSVGDLFDELIAAAAPDAAAKGLRLEAVSPEPPLRIRADRARVAMVLRHFLDNALRYTARGAVTLLAEPPGPADALAAGDRFGANGSAGSAEGDGAVKKWLRLAVRDTGPGIPAERQRGLFDEPLAPAPFRPGERRLIESRVGLPMCRRWAEMAGARVAVRSVPGEGSEFSLLLPPEAAQTTAEFDPEVPPLVLLVEDDPVSRRALARLLRGFGYRTVEAGDGRQGIETAEREQPALVLMDLMMPELDGMEAIRLMRENPSTRSIPAVVVTGDITEDRRRQADEVRVDGWVDKPVDLTRLREVIEGLLR
jgi:signal transduction histidine kinase